MPEFVKTPALYSQNLRTKSNTYFFDVRQAKNGHKYVTITESRIKDGQKFRSNLNVFAEHLQEFCQALQEAASQAK